MANDGECLILAEVEVFAKKHLGLGFGARSYLTPLNLWSSSLSPSLRFPNPGTKFYFQTNLSAPRYRLVTFDFAGEGPKYGTEAFKEVIAEHPKNVLSFASALKGK